MERGSALSLIETALKADNHKLHLLAFVVFFDMWQPLGSRQITVSKMPVRTIFKRHDIGLTRDAFDATPPLMKGSYPPFVESTPKWWRMGLNQTISYIHKSAPLIANGAVFAADDNSNLWRHNLETGDIEWQLPSLIKTEKAIVQKLQIHENSLIYGCYDGTVSKVNSENGEIHWRMRQDSSIHATPIVDLDKRRVYINTEQWNNGKPHGHLQCLNWDSGLVEWSHKHPYWPPGSPHLDPASKIVVATCNDLSIVALNSETGQLIWKQKTHGLVRGRPTIWKSSIFAATETGRLYRFDLQTGTVQWIVRFGRGQMHSIPKIIDNQVSVLEGKWHYSFFDVETGELTDIHRLRDAGLYQSESCGRYEVVLSKGGQLAVFDLSKKLKVWEDYVGGTYHQPPSIADGHLAIASNNQGLKLFKINEYYLK